MPSTAKIARARRAVVAVTVAWAVSCWVLFAGLVSGEGWLRVPGLAGVLVFGAAWVLATGREERLATRRWEQYSSVFPRERLGEPGNVVPITTRKDQQSMTTEAPSRRK